MESTDSVTSPHRPRTQAHLSALLHDSAAILAEILQADLTGVGEVIEQGTVLKQTIAAYDAEGRPLAPVRHRSSPNCNDSMAAYALKEAFATVTPDLATEGRFTDPVLRELGVISALCVRLQLNGEPFGTLGVYRKKKGDFTPADAWFATTVAMQVVSLIARIKGEEAVRQQGGEGLESCPPDDDEQDDGLRSSPRREYPYAQMIAPTTGGATPQQDGFFPVQCKDISGGGISLYLDHPPDFPTLVISLGTPPTLSQFRARVVHVEQVERDGQELYLVGCQFMDRLQL